MTPLTPDGFAGLTGVSRETLARLEAYAGKAVGELSNVAVPAAVARDGRFFSAA